MEEADLQILITQIKQYGLQCRMAGVKDLGEQLGLSTIVNG
jgi:hypothetical protein